MAADVANGWFRASSRSYDVLNERAWEHDLTEVRCISCLTERHVQTYMRCLHGLVIWTFSNGAQGLIIFSAGLR